MAATVTYQGMNLYYIC